MVEIEARALRRGIMKFVIGVGLVVVALAVLVGAFGFLLGGIYCLLDGPLPTWAAALIASGAGMVWVLILLVIAKATTK